VPDVILWPKPTMSLIFVFPDFSRYFYMQVAEKKLKIKKKEPA
jgi:hypothetical protein